MTLTMVPLLAAAFCVNPMTTPFGDKVTAANAWRDYPRPQMVRSNWTCLNGEWDYAVTSVTNTPGRPERWDGKIVVPFAIESKLSGVGRLLEKDEFLWYTRKIVCSPKAGRRILLHFGAVDFRTMVFIGHDEVTDVPHEGGNNPFTLDVTDYVKDGENDLTVCVWDPTEAFVNSRGKQAFVPEGCYYTRSSGIIQTVWLEEVPEAYIVGYKVTPDIDKGEVVFDFDLRGGARPAKIDVKVFAKGGEAVAAQSGDSRLTVRMPAGFSLWSPENPHLYGFTAKFGEDEVRGYFGMRKFSKGKDADGHLRFFLNNRPYYIMGTLDQGWWPDGLLTPPSDEAMAFNIKTLKDCGFNMMRKHIKVEPMRYYHLCDTMGILVLQDLPSGAHDHISPGKPETVARYWLQRTEMKEIMDNLHNSPSVVMWCPYNEGWSQPGEFLTHSMLDFVRRYDSTRLVNGSSGWWDWEGGIIRPNAFNGPPTLTSHKPDGVCEAGDVIDYHKYRGPDMPPVNSRRISFLGEFGGLGHPVEDHLWKVKPGGRGNWGYGGIKDTATREGLEKTYLGLMDRLGELVGKGLAGSVYTQTTDVEIEINGLMTYDRRVMKYNPAVLKAAHEKVIRLVK